MFAYIKARYFIFAIITYSSSANLIYKKQVLKKKKMPPQSQSSALSHSKKVSGYLKHTWLRYCLLT
jgi:hypothetical protein